MIQEMTLWNSFTTYALGKEEEEGFEVREAFGMLTGRATETSEPEIMDDIGFYNELCQTEKAGKSETEQPLLFEMKCLCFIG